MNLTTTGNQWNEDLINECWKNVDWDLKDMLLAICRRPQGYPVQIIERVAGLTRKQVLGRLAILNALHKQYKGLPRLFCFNRSTLMLSMDISVAELVSNEDRAGAAGFFESTLDNTETCLYPELFPSTGT